MAIAEKQIRNVSLQNRIKLAVIPRNITFQSQIKVLDGIPLKDVSPEQRKAFLIQERLKALTIEGLFDRNE